MRRLSPRLGFIFILVLLVGTTSTRIATQTAALRVLEAGPTGVIQQLSDANEIRVIFSEPMVALGRVPSNPLATITAAEAAFLAALPQEPSRYNPWRDPARAHQRAERIVQTMASRGWLTRSDATVARLERVALTRESASAVAPHFVSHVLAEVASDRPRRVETTLDAGLEREVTGIIGARRHALDDHHAENVAVAVLDNRTGEWLAWEGSGNYFDAAHGGTIDGVVTPRQPGSALKPFTYAAAFERGYDPASVLADVPSQFPTGEPGVLYSPRNYDGQYRGPLLARAALAGSENVPAVLLASEIGVPTIARFLRRTASRRSATTHRTMASA